MADVNAESNDDMSKKSILSQIMTELKSTNKDFS